MGETWSEATVGDIAAPSPGSISIGPFGSALKADLYSDHGVPVIRGQNIVEGNAIDETDMVFVPTAVAKKLARSIAHAGDLVFPHRGAIGRVGLVSQEYLLSSSMMKLTVDSELYDPRFFFYYFRGPGRQELLARASTVGTPGIGQPLSSLRGIPVRFPQLSEQRAIAEVLEALDHKIAANDKVLRVGDRLVRAMFDSLDDASTDGIPLSAVAENVRVHVDPSKVDPSVPYVGLEHVPRRSMWMSDIGAAGSVSSAKARFRTGDVLFGKLRPYFHKVVRADRDGVASTDILVVRAKDPVLGGFVLAAASSDTAIRATSAAVEGTRMPRTKWADLGAVTVPWPGEAAAIEFSSQVAVLCDQAATLQQESRVLAETRDEFLPLLMSGKIRVHDAEKRVEEVL